jgi:hypothetical protein
VEARGKQRNKEKKQDLGHETTRGTSRDLEGEGKGTKKRKISKSNKENEYDQSTLYVRVGEHHETPYYVQFNICQSKIFKEQIGLPLSSFNR